VTKEIHPKDVAAGWALARLPPEHRAVLARARSIYLGTEDEHWEDLRARIRPFADAMVAEIEAAVPDRARQRESDRPDTRCRVPTS
jgi:streptomycin 3"-adenylyltransferase